jgi:hypothetical protein
MHLFSGYISGRTRTVFRTVWFALFCLLGLGIVVAVRSTSRISAAVVASAKIDNTPRPTAKPDTQQDTLGKADRLPVFDVNAEVKVANAPSPTEAVSVGPPAPALPAATAKIVSRHWHDPNSIAPTDRTSAHRRAANKKDNKRNDAVAVDAADGSSCSQGSAFLRSLKLVPSCR